MRPCAESRPAVAVWPKPGAVGGSRLAQRRDGGLTKVTLRDLLRLQHFLLCHRQRLQGEAHRPVGLLTGPVLGTAPGASMAAQAEESLLESVAALQSGIDMQQAIANVRILKTRMASAERPLPTPNQVARSGADHEDDRGHS